MAHHPCSGFIYQEAERLFHSPADGRIEYQLTIRLLPVFFVLSLTTLWFSGMYIPRTVWLSIAGGISFFFALHAFYTHYRPVERLSLISGSLTLMFASSLVAGIMAHASMRLHMPFIDARLASADRAIGLDTPSIVLAVARVPEFARLLQVAYLSIVPLCMAIAAGLSLAGRAARVWELVFGYCTGILTCALISTVYPALGNIELAGLSHQVTGALPQGSGTYHMDAVHYFRDSQNSVLDFDRFSGVVTFPSFHAIMAIVASYALRGTGLAGNMISAWAALVIASTVPIGGHYVVDLLAGAFLWITAIMVTRALRTRRERDQSRVIGGLG